MHDVHQTQGNLMEQTALSDRILSSHEKNASEAPQPVLHRRRYAGLWSTQHCI